MLFMLKDLIFMLFCKGSLQLELDSLNFKVTFYIFLYELCHCFSQSPAVAGEFTPCLSDVQSQLAFQAKRGKYFIIYFTTVSRHKECVCKFIFTVVLFIGHNYSLKISSIYWSLFMKLMKLLHSITCIYIFFPF